MDLTTHQNSNWNQDKVIGNGSYGVVSLGFCDGEPFAVKSADKNNIISVQALENEIDVLQCVSSPYIVKYYSEGDSVLHKNLFMEYLSGGDVARGGKVADVEVIRMYTWCLVSALWEVHEKGFVHCDVKGSNLLVAGTVAGVVKLADFGSAKRVANDCLPRGSPLWMAPEVVRGESQGFAADVWAVGCTVIEMFTGMPAWQDNGAHTLYKIGYSEDLPEFPDQLPELAKDFFEKCLVREPGRRWCCDQLLNHPFLIPLSLEKEFDVSPRSILDWDSLNFTDEEVEFHESQNIADEISARGRIAKLSTSLGVNWESDGWLDVRNVKKEENIITTPDVTCYREYFDSELQNDEDSAWITISTEIDEVGISSGDDSNGGGHGGSIDKQENKEKVVTTENVLFWCLLVTLYSSTSIEVRLNVTKLMLLLLMQIHWFWFKFMFPVSSMVFPFSLNLNDVLIYLVR